MPLVPNSPILPLKTMYPVPIPPIGVPLVLERAKRDEEIIRGIEAVRKRKRFISFSP